MFGGRLIPVLRTAIAGICVAAASGLEFAAYWRDGVQYQGVSYTITTALLSFCCASALLFLLIRSSLSSSFGFRLAANFLLFAWTVTYAFPYLGELP